MRQIRYDHSVVERSEDETGILDPREAEARAEQEAEEAWLEEERDEEERASLEERHLDEMEAEYEREQELQEREEMMLGPPDGFY